MSHKFLLPLAMLLLPALVNGQGVTTYTCTMAELQRRVVILTEPGVTVPCEVQYHKDTEAPGEVEVLWSAATQADFCESRTEDFIAQLQGWGWSCAAGDGAAAQQSAPSEPSASSMPAKEKSVDETAGTEPAADQEAEEFADDTADLEPAN